jgi:hypothetical protein
MSNDTLEVNEAHPSSENAKRYILSIPLDRLMAYLDAFSSTAIAGSRLGEICSGTLNRIIKAEPVSDRYLLGLAWAIRNMEEKP